MSSLLLPLFLITSFTIHACEGRSLHPIKDAEVKVNQDEVLVISPDAATITGGAEIGRRLPRAASWDGKRKQELLGLGAVETFVIGTSSIKHRDQHPGFDVDYVGPRTHPPSHN